jgi:hypothetical protein
MATKISSVKTKSILLGISLIIAGCYHKVKQAEQRLVKSINGEIYYIFNKQGEVALAYKPGYNNPDFAVMIKHDTVKLGDSLEAMINVPKSNFKVTINLPMAMSYTQNDVKVDYKYRYKTIATGAFEFSGFIEYDTVSIPFFYNFFVK